MDDPFQLRRDFRFHRLKPLWLLINDGVEQGNVVLRFEWQFAGQHLIQDYTQRPQIGTMVNLFPLGLFRGHIGHRAQSTSSSGQVRLTRQLCQSEVDYLDRAILGDQEVGRFDVPVNNSLPVSFLQPTGRLNCCFDRVFDCDRSSFDLIPEGFPAVESHDNVHLPGFRLVEFVDSTDVGMIQLGDSLRLVDEAFTRLFP